MHPADVQAFQSAPTRARSFEMILYYKRSTTRYHVYYYFGKEGPPIAQYFLREWFSDNCKEYGLKSAKYKNQIAPPSSVTTTITIDNQ
jgi:hypothetical protein